MRHLICCRRLILHVSFLIQVLFCLVTTTSKHRHCFFNSSRRCRLLSFDFAIVPFLYPTRLPHSTVVAFCVGSFLAAFQEPSKVSLFDCHCFLFVSAQDSFPFLDRFFSDNDVNFHVQPFSTIHGTTLSDLGVYCTRCLSNKCLGKPTATAHAFGKR